MIPEMVLHVMGLVLIYSNVKEATKSEVVSINIEKVHLCMSVRV